MNIVLFFIFLIVIILICMGINNKTSGGMALCQNREDSTALGCKGTASLAYLCHLLSSDLEMSKAVRESIMINISKMDNKDKTWAIPLWRFLLDNEFCKFFILSKEPYFINDNIILRKNLYPTFRRFSSDGTFNSSEFYKYFLGLERSGFEISFSKLLPEVDSSMLVGRNLMLYGMYARMKKDKYIISKSITSETDGFMCSISNHRMTCIRVDKDIWNLYMSRARKDRETIEQYNTVDLINMLISKKHVGFRFIILRSKYKQIKDALTRNKESIKDRRFIMKDAEYYTEKEFINKFGHESEKEWDVAEDIRNIYIDGLYYTEEEFYNRFPDFEQGEWYDYIERVHIVGSIYMPKIDFIWRYSKKDWEESPKEKRLFKPTGEILSVTEYIPVLNKYWDDNKKIYVKDGQYQYKELDHTYDPTNTFDYLGEGILDHMGFKDEYTYKKKYGWRKAKETRIVEDGNYYTKDQVIDKYGLHDWIYHWK